MIFALVNLSSINNKSFNMNQKTSFDKKEAKNLIDTLDFYARNKETVAYSNNKSQILIPSIIASGITSYGIVHSIACTKNFNLKQILPFTILSTFLSGIAYGYFTKKRAGDNHKAYLEGQNEGLNEYLKTIKSKESLDNLDVTEYINKIDSDAQKYNLKVLSGLNSIFAGVGVISVGVIAGLQKLVKQNSKFKIPVAISSLLILLANGFTLGKLSNSSFYDNLKQISRYRSKEGFNDELDNNDLKTCIEYLKTQNYYKDKLVNDNRLYSTKYNHNNLLKNSTNKDMQISSDMQKQLNNQIFSVERLNKLNKNSMTNSYLKDYLINVASIPFSILAATGIVNDMQSKGEKFKFNKNYLYAMLVLTFASFLNLGLIKSSQTVNK